jgi:hypothetical protein
VQLEPGETLVRLKPEEFAQLKVEHPKLWWPNGYGEPTLHTLKVSVSPLAGKSAEQQIDFGMRELSYETLALRRGPAICAAWRCCPAARTMKPLPLDQ